MIDRYDPHCRAAESGLKINLLILSFATEQLWIYPDIRFKSIPLYFLALPIFFTASYFLTCIFFLPQGEAFRLPVVAEAARRLLCDAHWRRGGCQVSYGLTASCFLFSCACLILRFFGWFLMRWSDVIVLDADQTASRRRVGVSQPNSPPAFCLKIVCSREQRSELEHAKLG